MIAPDIILTAGHCKPDKHNHVKPKVGTWSFSHDIKGVDYQEFEIVKAIRHSDFEKVSDDDFINDFTILKLNGQSTHSTIKVNRNPHIPKVGQQVIAMGVGDTDPSPKHEKISDVLRHVPLSVISNQECSQAASIQRNLTYAKRIFPSMMCTTGGPHNERDSWYAIHMCCCCCCCCFLHGVLMVSWYISSYDSGSPIIIPAGHGGQRHDLLVGLVSWGEECADADFPAVNARVSEVADWIDEVVCELSENPPADFCRKRHLSWHRSWAIGIVAIVMVGIVVFMFRKRQDTGAQRHEKLPPSEQSSLSDYSTTSSDEDNYDAVEIM